MYGCACLGLVLCSLENKQAGFAVTPSTLGRLLKEYQNVKMNILERAVCAPFSSSSLQSDWMRKH